MENEPKPSLAGVRVLSLESRRAAEMVKPISHYGGAAVVAPSMREIAIETNTEAMDFVRKLELGDFHTVIFLTGVGTRALARVAETVGALQEFTKALSRVKVIARGPKPVAVLKELSVPVTLTVPEPNTWRDILKTLDENRESVQLRGKKVAVQEYGKTNEELLAGLSERGAIVTRVPVYQWALPEDTGPLRQAVEQIVAGQIGLALFTTSVQVVHLMQIAREMNREDAVRSAFARIAVGSIGPVTSEELREEGIAPDFEPPHPKMGFLVNEAAQRAPQILEQKGH